MPTHSPLKPMSRMRPADGKANQPMIAVTVPPTASPVAATGLAVGGTVTALIGWFALPPAGLILLMGFSGLCVGMTYPSRDMLVRAVTPPNACGRVFGFVSMGFNIGASIAPIIYGAMMDHGEPLAVFMLSAAVCIICISTVTFGFSRREVH